MRKKPSEGGVIHLPLRVPGGEDGTLNFVPIDYVVDGMIEIGRNNPPGGAYHLTNPHPTENRVWLPNICRLLGVDGIQLVQQDSFLRHPMTKLEALFQRQMAFYYMYLQGEPQFDCSRTREALRHANIECPRVTVQFIERMVGWYVQFLNQIPTTK
jgi:nucleoside-diphosphate-sugar epimerase